MYLIDVVRQPSGHLALKITSNDGRTYTVSDDTDIRSEKGYEEVFGLPNNQDKKYLRRRWLSVLLLLILAQVDPDEVKALGYGTPLNGRIRLAAVSQLKDFAKYATAPESKVKAAIRAFLPASGAIRIGRDRDPDIWLDEERVKVQANPAERSAIVAYLDSARRPQGRRRIVIEISGVTGEEVERAARRVNALMDLLLAIRRGDAGPDPAQALTRWLKKAYDFLDLLVGFIGRSDDKDK